MILGPDGNPVITGVVAEQGYRIPRSVRFYSANGDYFYRTPGSAGNRQKYTVSMWYKRANNWGANQYLLEAYSDTNNRTTIYFDASSRFSVYSVTGGAGSISKIASKISRDWSAWMHLVVTVDTTLATAEDRVKMWINNERITTFATNTNPAQNHNTWICNNVLHRLGCYGGSVTYPLDGYLADVYIIDGLALDPTYFAEVNPNNSTWWPKLCVSARGTTGSFLNFRDGTSTTTLGYDEGAGANDWTPSANLSVAAGVNNDWLRDSPTNNFAVLMCDRNNGSSNYVKNGSLNCNIANYGGYSSIPASAFNSYCEYTTDGTSAYIGILSEDRSTAYNVIISANKTVGLRWVDGTVDYKNITDGGAWTNRASGLTGVWHFYGSGTNANIWANFGQRDFAGTQSGKALCADNLPAPQHIRGYAGVNALLYTGNGGTKAVTGARHQPDLVIVKQRTGTVDNSWYDSVRGVQKRLEGNTTDAQVTSDAGVTSFDADGFSLSTLAQVNTNATTYVGHVFKKGAATGLDIVTWTGNGSAQNIAHALGVVPAMIIAKCYSAGTTNWYMYHQYMNAFVGPAQNYYISNWNGRTDGTTVWNDTAPTSSVFTVGTDLSVQDATYVAYVFAEIAGYSRFGWYIGSGGSNNAPSPWCGFKPALLWITGMGTGATYVYDGKRPGLQGATASSHVMGTTAAEATTPTLDLISTGFMPRQSTVINAVSTYYMFAAWAECPFKYARAA